MFLGCICSDVTYDGYGKCQKRSLSFGGKFICVVNQTSNCNDIKKDPKTELSVSADACKEFNTGDKGFF